MHFMNPQRGKHMHGEGGEEHHGGSHPHSIHIHHAGSGAPHAHNPHHVHVHHADGRHEHSDHGNFQEAMDHAHSVIGSGGGEQRPEPEEPNEGLQDTTY